VVVDGAALPRESHNQEPCPVHDDRSTKPEIISLVRHLCRLRTVVRWLVKAGRVEDGARKDGPGAPGIDQHAHLN
jgi:hypothetical protein